ncbi:MAG: polysaccharide biosynthesis protein [Candidatus Eisenbacteria bacterium]|uniref:Polysaccharide biosynthesis protein n=1 Tax=Eiseniibacteriota bacterium TaxID=2212470 RepID=A0A538UCY1_UNCEI|nr:MAG: polysaccharide biosynthesis protein [Candidatus Eisenbacteria bacterium]
MEGVLDRLAPRHRLVTGLVQSALAAVAAVAALRLRYGATPPPEIANLVMAGLPIVMVVRAFWFDRTGLTRDVWQYFGADEALAIVAACALGSVTLGLPLLWRSPFTDAPLALLVIDAVLCVALLSGARVLRCVHRRLARKALAKRRVLIVGTDDEAERLVHGLTAHPLYDYVVVGLVGPLPSHRGLTVHDAPILGCFRQLPEVIRAHDPDEIMVVSSAVPSDERREVVRLCRQSDCPVHVVPDLSDSIIGRSRVEVVDPEATEALLFREPLDLNLALLRKTIAGRRILVTGAGGSIGSEICRQVADLDAAALVLLERHEHSLFELERALRASHPRVALRPMLGDVRDGARVEEVLALTRPQMIFHAAAYKHVPMVEHNPLEAVKTNVLGTWVVADAAARAGVEVFVLISTDKAVDPVSVMGATKRMAELMVHSMSATSRTRFLAVRFGNVLDSSGSVLPLFREQIRKGGPVTVTHPDATRWFMTVPEAVKLILTASGIGRGGEVFVLDMGKPVRILDLARALIRQYGLRPERDVPIVFTGLRPGERVYERLFGECEVIQKTSHPRILMATHGATNGNGRPHHSEEFHRLLQAVQGAAGGLTPDLRDAVAELEAVCA